MLNSEKIMIEKILPIIQMTFLHLRNAVLSAHWKSSKQYKNRVASF